MTLLATLLQLAGLALIAASMHSAPAPVRKVVHGRQRRIAIAGSGLLVASALIVLVTMPFGFALLDWIGLLTLSSALILLISTMIARAGKQRHRRRAMQPLSGTMVDAG